MQDLNERIASAETRLDSHDKRLDAHGRQIDELLMKDIRQDAKLDSLCKDVKENTAITRSIKGGIDTIKWLIAGMTTLGGLWLMLKQMGWF